MLETVMQGIGWAILAAGSIAMAAEFVARRSRRTKTMHLAGRTLYRCPSCRIYAPWTHGIDEYHCQVCGTVSELPSRIMRRAGERQAKS